MYVGQIIGIVVSVFCMFVLMVILARLRFYYSADSHRIKRRFPDIAIDIIISLAIWAIAIQAVVLVLRMLAPASIFAGSAECAMLIAALIVAAIMILLAPVSLLKIFARYLYERIERGFALNIARKRGVTNETLNAIFSGDETNDEFYKAIKGFRI